MNPTAFIILFLMLLGGIIGVLKRNALSPPIFRFFPYFLFFQFGYQLAATLYSFVFTNHNSNHLIFNVAYCISFIFLAFFFHQIMVSKLKRKVISLLAFIWVFFYFINLAFIQGIDSLMTYSRTLMGGIIVIYALLYFHELLTDDENDRDPLRDASFWCVTALFFFYLCSTLTLSLWNFLIINEVYIGPTMLNIFAFMLYSMYIAGFILHKNPKKDASYRY